MTNRDLLSVILDALSAYEDVIKSGDRDWPSYPSPTPDPEATLQTYLRDIHAASQVIATLMPGPRLTTEQQNLALRLIHEGQRDLAVHLAADLQGDANARDYTSRDIWIGTGPPDLQERFRALSDEAAIEFARLAYDNGDNDWRADAGLTATTAIETDDHATTPETRPLRPHRVLFENGDEVNVMAFDRDDAELRTNTPERDGAWSVIDLIEFPEKPICDVCRGFVMPGTPNPNGPCPRCGDALSPKRDGA